MPRTHTDEAIVLRAHNVGESDRFLILLTKNLGKVAARARAVRKPLTKHRAGLLPLHCISAMFTEHSFGYVLSSVDCTDTSSHVWQSTDTFGSAGQAIELTLKLIEDGHPVPEVYDLFFDFLKACRSPLSAVLFPAYGIKLLGVQGILPSVTHSCVSHQQLPNENIVYSQKHGGLCAWREDPSGLRLSVPAMQALITITSNSLKDLPVLLAADEVERLLYSLLGNQLGLSLSAPAFAASISSAVAPSCHVSGRAS